MANSFATFPLQGLDTLMSASPPTPSTPTQSAAFPSTSAANASLLYIGTSSEDTLRDETNTETPDAAESDTWSMPGTDVAEELGQLNELDDEELEQADLQGEAEASVNALLNGPVASTEPDIFQDMIALMESASLYDASLDWLEWQLAAHRDRIRAYEGKDTKPAAELEELVRASEDIERISAQLKKMRRELLWAEHRFKRKYYCGH